MLENFCNIIDFCMRLIVWTTIGTEFSKLYRTVATWIEAMLKLKINWVNVELRLKMDWFINFVTIWNCFMKFKKNLWQYLRINPKLYIYRCCDYEALWYQRATTAPFAFIAIIVTEKRLVWKFTRICLSSAYKYNKKQRWNWEII